MFQPPGFLLDQLPGPPNVPLLRSGLTDAESQTKAFPEQRMCQVESPAVIQPLQQLPVEPITSSVRKANQVQEDRRP